MTPEIFGGIVAGFVSGVVVGMFSEMWMSARDRLKQVRYSALSSPRVVSVMTVTKESEK